MPAAGSWTVRAILGVMSSANVEVIRALMPDPETDVARMVRYLRSPGVEHAALKELESLFDPSFEAIGVYTGSPRYRGAVGLRDFWIEWLEPWASYHITV